MKKLLSTIVLMLSPLLANADAVEVNGIYYNLIEKFKAAEVTKNPYKYGGDIVIPSTIKHNNVEYNVTMIGEEAFYKNYISSVVIPNSIISIGDRAFQGCG